MKAIIRFIVKRIINPQWVAFNFHDTKKDTRQELGISIFGIVIGLYKGNTIYPTNPINIRKPNKREFGESLYPINSEEN